MLKNKHWYCYLAALKTELLQCKDEGKDVSAYEKEAEAINILAPYTEEEYEKNVQMVNDNALFVGFVNCCCNSLRVLNKTRSDSNKKLFHSLTPDVN